MNLAILLSKMRLAPRDAEVIFDRDEPVGAPTDLVLPVRRWFRRERATASRHGGGQATRRNDAGAAS
jgi:hypothetical protein